MVASEATFGPRWRSWHRGQMKWKAVDGYLSVEGSGATGHQMWFKIAPDTSGSNGVLNGTSLVPRSPSLSGGLYLRIGLRSRVSSPALKGLLSIVCAFRSSFRVLFCVEFTVLPPALDSFKGRGKPKRQRRLVACVNGAFWDSLRSVGPLGLPVVKVRFTTLNAVFKVIWSQTSNSPKCKSSWFTGTRFFIRHERSSVGVIWNWDSYVGKWNAKRKWGFTFHPLAK